MDVTTPHPLESGTEPSVDDYQRLLVALQDAALGDLIFVQINSPVQRRQLPEKLTACGLNRPFGIVDFATFQPGPPPHGILREFLADLASPPPEILFVDGLEYWIDANPKPGGALEALNLGRERLAALGVVLVFLLPTYLINIIRSHAQNLWSWRAYYYSLDPTKAESIPRDKFSSPGMGYEATPGDTPEDRDRRIRILQGLLDKELTENRSLDSLIQPLLLPLARELYAAGRFTGALTVLDRLGADSAKGHPADATVLNFRALVLQALGKFKEAEQLYLHALTLREKNLGLDHPGVATILHNLSLLYDHQGKYTEAEHLEEQALTIREQVLGPEHPEVAATLNNLALIYHAQGQYAEAEPLYQRALFIYERILGSEHPNMAVTLNNLARLYHTQGQYTEAERLYKQALGIREKVFGRVHPDTAISLSNLALLYHAQGRYAEAEPLYQRALETLEKALGPEHPSLANSFNDLAEFYYVQGKYAEAEDLFQKALRSREKMLGSDHPNVAASLENYARLLRQTNREAEALELESRAQAIRSKNA